MNHRYIGLPQVRERATLEREALARRLAEIRAQTDLLEAERAHVALELAALSRRMMAAAMSVTGSGPVSAWSDR